MKVIGFTGNYDASAATTPSCYLMADSSVLYTGRPFFIHDFAEAFVAAPSIVVRMGRLGKCVAPKFAHRYWDAVTAGFNVQACRSRDAGLEALDRAFDGAAIVGDWVEQASLDDPMHATVSLAVNGEEVSSHCLDDMQQPLDELMAAVSSRCSIKMGDAIFTGDAGGGYTLAPGDRLTATIGGKPVLDVKVKL